MKNEPKRFEDDEEKHSDPLTSSITLKRTSKVGRNPAKNWIPKKFIKKDGLV